LSDIAIDKPPFLRYYSRIESTLVMIMEFCIGDAPDLAKYVLSCFADDATAHPEVESELVRFFWNSADYGVALPIEKGGAERLIQGGKNFVFDRKTGLVFFDVSFGKHQLLMAYFGALCQTDFSQSTEDWHYKQFVEPWDPHAKLVDFYLEKGHGLFQSHVGEKEVIYVCEDFQFTPLERQAFRRFSRREPR
jgi:hypothetical protein